jgi:hypothetical protein
MHSLAADRAALGSINIIGVILNTVIWALVVLLTLDNLGIDITALVAGLGIGAASPWRLPSRTFSVTYLHRYPSRSIAHSLSATF